MKQPRGFHVLLAVLCVSASALGQKPVAPAAGTFLVAKSEIESGPFHQSVVLLMVHNDQGTLGLIVNRASDVPLAEALPEIGSDTSHTLYFGGPVALTGLIYLIKSNEPPDNADHVVDDVYYSGDRDLLKELIEAETPSDELHLFLGHAGWAPGQLDAELVRGSWDVVPADGFTIFGKDPATIWHELSKDSRVIARFSPPPPTSSRTSPGEGR